jgi:hypothetical protein
MAGTETKSRVTADNFRNLTARLRTRQAEAPVPVLAPQPAPAPYQPPPMAAPPVTQRAEPAPPPQPAMPPPIFAPEPIIADPAAPPFIPEAAATPFAFPEPAPVVLPPVAVQPEPVRAQTVSPSPFAAQPEIIPPQVAQAPVIQNPFDAPRFEPQPFEPLTKRSAPAKGEAEPPARIDPSRISAVISRTATRAKPAETLEEKFSGVYVPPILPAPIILPPPPPPEPVDESFLKMMREHMGRAKTHDLELEYVMRMVASQPSLDERAQYLEEAARYEEELRAQQVYQAPVEDLEALAMQHVEAFEREQIAPQTEVAEAPSRPFDEAAAMAAGDVPEQLSGSDAASQSFDLPVETAAEPYVEIPQASAEPEPVIAEPVVAPSPPPQPRPVAQARLSARQPTSVAPEPRPVQDVPQAILDMSDDEVAELARSLLDMMAAGASAGQPQERALAADTLLRILPRLPLRPTIVLADRLSIMENPPHLLINKLLRDERIEVAGPLLENCMQITDQDLLGVVDEGDVKKHRMIARRRRLSRSISDRLIDGMDTSVLLTLVRNASAEISHAGFLKLTERAAEDHDLLAPLCTRADLPPPQAFELFWAAPTQLRRYLLNRFLTDSETLTKILKITMATQGEDASSQVFPNSNRTKTAIEALAAGKLEVASFTLADIAQISSAAVTRIIDDSAGDSFAVLLKATGFPRADVLEAFEILQRCEGAFVSVHRNLEELTSLFDTLSFNKARILLTYWDWAAQKTGPYAPVH